VLLRLEKSQIDRSLKKSEKVFYKKYSDNN